MLVAPGTYHAVLTANGKEYRSDFNVVADPRLPLDGQALTAAMAMSKAVTGAMDRQFMTSGEVQSVRTQLKTLADKLIHNAALADASGTMSARMAVLDQGSGEQATLNLSFIGSQLASLQTDLEGSDRAPTQPQRDVYADYSSRLERAQAAWTVIKAEDLPRLNAALKDDGVDPRHPNVEALAPYDQFHGRGFEATVEMADQLAIGATDHILDVGSGIGGPARYLAHRFGCRVTGIDLTAEFCDVARELTQLLGLDGKIKFEHG